jgi:hypothetical protein
MISQKRILILKVGQIEKTEELFKGSSFEKLVYRQMRSFKYLLWAMMLISWQLRRSFTDSIILYPIAIIVKPLGTKNAIKYNLRGSPWFFYNPQKNLPKNLKGPLI